MKPFCDAFVGTTLDYDLRQQGVTQVFVTGAMADFDADSYRHSVEKIFPRINERATTAEVLGLLN